MCFIGTHECFAFCLLTAIWNIHTIFIRVCAACATWIFHINYLKGLENSLFF